MERWAGSQAAGGAADTPEGGRRMARAIPPATSAEDVAPDLVAAFCQANVGDTSPNTLGAFCMDTGLPCDAVHSTCGGRVQQCIGRGPGWPDHFNSTRIIAGKQTSKAQELLVQANKQGGYTCFGNFPFLSRCRPEQALSFFLRASTTMLITHLCYFVCGCSEWAHRVSPRVPGHAWPASWRFPVHWQPVWKHMQASHGICIRSRHHRRSWCL